jgi:hypothetical protein
MRWQLLVIATLAAGCLDSDHDIEVVFRVVDTTGAPRPEATTTCGGDCEDDGSGCFLRGTVAELDDGDRLCTVAAAATQVWIEASIGPAHVDIYVAPRSSDRTVVLWAPTVTAEEIGDDLVIAWTPSPQTPDSGEGAQIIARVYPSIDETWLPLDATSLTLAREDFEDFDARISFQVDQRIGLTLHEQWISSIDLAHTPVLPASRGAACTLMYREGPGPAVSTVTFDAGTCPLTDGVTEEFECEGVCSDFVGIVDLGTEQLVRRVVVRGASGPIAVSTDGVAFTEVGAPGDELSPPVSARYVRARGEPTVGEPTLHEISVFTP